MTIRGTRARRAAMVVLVAGLWTLGGASAAAQDQSTSVPAEPNSLGTIPPPSGIVCGVRSLSFYASGVDMVQTLAVEITMSFTGLRAHGATLQSPGGRNVSLFSAYTGSYANPVDGTYIFSDSAGSSWLPFVPSNGASPVPSGHYRALDGTTTISLDAAFADELGTGVWQLSVYNCGNPATGLVSSARLYIGGTAGVLARATTGTVGAVPDGPSATVQTPGPPRDVTFVVPPGRGVVTRVAVNLSLSHTWVGDLVVRLIAPTGQSHVLFGYTGATSAIGKGYRADVAGYYLFRDGATSSWWSSALNAGAGTVPEGAYRTSGLGGPGATGAATAMDPVFAGLPSAGTWTLRITDGAAGDIGSINSATLSFETLMIPEAVDDTYSAAYLQGLSRAAPGVMLNDNDNGVPIMRAELVSGPSQGTLSLQPDGAFTYTPRTGFAGIDSFRYRATSPLGAGRIATATITVRAPTAAQPPFGLVVDRIAGQEVTLRWKTAPGPAPTDFVLEGGIAPGHTIGVVGIGGPLPVLTFTAPRGVFFVRVRAVVGGAASAPSNEIRIVVDVPETPSSPADFAGVVTGDLLGLSWRNTFNGGAPDDLELLVSGAATAVLALPLGESFSVGGVPPGTYSFRMRARNRSGTSAVSNPVTLTFPGACSGPPSVPVNLLVFTVGNVVHAYWDPPPSGSAATGYVLNVTGAFTGSVPLPVRGLHVPVPPGSYGLAVAAQNACGVSAFTASQTAFAR